jgi:hypothetical protein
MKERELRAHATCSICKKKIGHSGVPLFYRLTVEQFGVKLDAVRRQAGLEMMLGGHVAIAQAMGPDEDMAMPVMEKLVLVVCEPCSLVDHCVAQLAEVESTVTDGSR